VERRHEIGLLEERMRRLVRRRQKDHAPDASREALDDGGDRGRPGGSDQEDGVDPGEGWRQGIGVCEIAEDDLDVDCKRGGRRATHERTDRAAEAE
jgi:hypothetical protein